jgi:hypothetical protein
VNEAPAAVSGLAKTAWGDSMFFSKLLTVSITGLDSTQKYDLLFYGSRAVRGQQQVWHLAKGTGGSDLTHSSMNNTTDVVNWKNIASDSNGEIELTITVSGSTGALNFGSITASR